MFNTPKTPYNRCKNQTPQVLKGLGLLPFQTFTLRNCLGVFRATSLGVVEKKDEVGRWFNARIELSEILSGQFVITAKGCVKNVIQPTD